MILDLFASTLWLTRQAFGLFLFYWPVDFLILLANLIAMFKHKRQLNMWEINRVSFWRLVLPTSLSLIMLLCGSIFRADDGVGLWKNVGLPAIYSLLAIQLILSGWVIFKAGGYRAVAATVTAMQFWISVVCAVIARMSVTGDWP